MDWCWSWNSNPLATSCKELTHWKRPWCWEGLGAGVKGDDRGWDGWMASPTLWTWVWVNSGSWWWTGRPGVLRFMGSQRVGHDWAIELNWSKGWDWTKFLFYLMVWLALDYGYHLKGGLPWWLRESKNLPANAGDVGLIPGSLRSPGEGNGNLL